MPANKRPRKRFRPRDYQVAPLQMLAELSNEPLVADEVRDLMIAAHSALESIEKGHAQEEDIVMLAAASNVSLILAEHGFGPEHIPEVKEAQRHIVGLQERFNSKQSIALSGPGILACRRLLELYDAQVEHPEVNKGAMRHAMRLVIERMKAGHVEVAKA
jgi:hypothetical protein